MAEFIVIDLHEIPPPPNILVVCEKASHNICANKAGNAWLQMLESNETLPVGDIAHQYGLGARDFNKLLCSMGIQSRSGNGWKLAPAYCGNGYTEERAFQIPRRDGSTLTKTYMLWTQAGRHFLYYALRCYGYLPLAEQ